LDGLAYDTFSLLVIIVLIILAGLLIPVGARLWSWLIIQALLAVFVVIAGQIVVHTRPEHAQWADMFKGEETGNAAYLDMAKIQMLFFTFVVALAYAVTLATLFGSDETNISALPALSQSIVALLGISRLTRQFHTARPAETTLSEKIFGNHI